MVSSVFWDTYYISISSVIYPHTDPLKALPGLKNKLYVEFKKKKNTKNTKIPILDFNVSLDSSCQDLKLCVSVYLPRNEP